MNSGKLKQDESRLKLLRQKVRDSRLDATLEKEAVHLREELRPTWLSRLTQWLCDRIPVLADRC